MVAVGCTLPILEPLLSLLELSELLRLLLALRQISVLRHAVHHNTHLQLPDVSLGVLKMLLHGGKEEGRDRNGRNLQFGTSGSLTS